MLLSLFLWPSGGIVTAQLYRIWVPAVVFIILAVGTASLIRASSIGRPLAKIHEDVRAVNAKIAPVRIEGGRLFWNEGLADGYSADVNGWLVSFSESFPEHMVAESSGSRGIAILHDSVLFWMKEQNAGGVRTETLLDSRKIRRLAEGNGQEGAYDRDALDRLAAAACVMAVPAWAIFSFLYFSWSIVFCMFIFCLSSLFMRRDVGRSKSELVVACINLSVPPVLVSLAWFAGAPASWSFENIYFISFILYVLYVFKDARRAAQGS